MKVAIIGGGFTGLTAGEYLTSKGVEVKIWEESEQLGGLAGNFRNNEWEWGLEKYYHHIFSNDKEVISLAERVGWPAFFKRPQTNVWLEDKERQLDSAWSLLAFSDLSFWQRVRMGAGLGLLKMIYSEKWGMRLERFRVSEALPKLIGRKGYEKVWEPLLKAKFAKFTDDVNMAWFWARVVKRTSSLGYFEGGFGKLAEKVGEMVEKKGGKIKVGVKVERVEKNKKGFVVDGEEFDRVLLTIPAEMLEKVVEGEIKMPKIDYLWGQALVLELEKSLISGYWLNVLEKDWPFLVAVEHTKFIDKSRYGGSHIVYLGNYLVDGDERLRKDKNELLHMYWPYLRMLNPKIDKSWVKGLWKFEDRFAQPVFPVNYSSQIAKVKTRVEGLYVANMSQVYPWDRGVNYAVKLGREAAELMMKRRI